MVAPRIGGRRLAGGDLRNGGPLIIFSLRFPFFTPSFDCGDTALFIRLLAFAISEPTAPRGFGDDCGVGLLACFVDRVADGRFGRVPPPIGVLKIPLGFLAVDAFIPVFRKGEVIIADAGVELLASPKLKPAPAPASFLRLSLSLLLADFFFFPSLGGGEGGPPLGGGGGRRDGRDGASSSSSNRFARPYP